MKSTIGGGFRSIPMREVSTCSYVRRNEDIALGTTAELFFCMQYIGHYICRSDFHIRRRGEESALLMLTLSGEGRLSYRGSQYTLTRGACMLIDTRCEHEYCSVGSGWEFKYLHFWGAMSEKYVAYIEAHLSPVFELSEDEFERVESILDHILEASEEEDITDYSGLSCSIYSLISTLLSQDVQRSYCNEPSGARTLPETIAFIRQNYARGISVEDIARAVNLSRSYMTELFTKSYGMPPHEYMVRYRLSIAKNMLLNTDMSVTEIAEQTGFRDIFSFSRVFKRELGVSPAKYRQKYNKEI